MELSTLPNELITLIAEQLDKADLRTLATVSSGFRDIAEPLLYANLFIRIGPECQRLFETLKHGRRERAASVHNLDLRALYRHEIGLQHLPSILAITTKLRGLIIESPVCNAMRWKGDGNWPVLMRLFSQGLHDASGPQIQNEQPRPLQCLKKLTLHWNGPASRYWSSYAMFDALFCSQTLEELCISCANCPNTLHEAAQERHLLKKTPLKRLTLIECNITTKGLLGMLRMPAALEHLYLGENRDHVSSRYSGDSRDHVSLQYSGNRLLEEPAAFFEALLIHSGSLRSLHYRPQPRPRRHKDAVVQPADDECSFSTFQKLESVILEEGCSPLIELILSEHSRPPKIQSIRFSLEIDEAHTPNLELVAASRRANQKLPLEYADLVRFADKALTIASLKKFDIVLSSSYLEARMEDHILSTAEYIQTRLTEAVLVRVLVERHMAGIGRLIPPYLHGEMESWLETVYHGSNGRWIGLRRSSRRPWASPSPLSSESDSEDLEELFEGDGEIDLDFDDFREDELDDNDDDEEVNEEVYFTST